MLLRQSGNNARHGNARGAATPPRLPRTTTRRQALGQRLVAWASGAALAVTVTATSDVAVGLVVVEAELPVVDCAPLGLQLAQVHWPAAHRHTLAALDA